MVRAIVKDALFLGQKSLPATPEVTPVIHRRDSASFTSGGHKIYHERSAIGDMLSAIRYVESMGLILRNQAFIHIQEDKQDEHYSVYLLFYSNHAGVWQKARTEGILYLYKR